MIRADGESDEDYAARWETRRRAWTNASGLPATLVKPVLWDQVPPEVHAAAKRWADGETLGLLLTGDIGVYKTTIAASLFSYRCGFERGYWRSLKGLLDGMTAPYDSPERTAAVDVASGRRMLALDDLDKSRDTPWAREQVFGVIDAVVANGQRLLVTSNSTIGGLSTMWGDPVASRLKGHCEVVRISGPDRRLG